MARPPQSERNPGTVEITEMRSGIADPRSERQTTRPPTAELPAAALPSIHPPKAPVPKIAMPAIKETAKKERGETPSSLIPTTEREVGITARLHRQIAQLQEQLAEAQRDLSLTNQERAAEAERHDELQVQLLTLQKQLSEVQTRLQAEQEAATTAAERQAELEREVAMLRGSLQQRVRDEMKRIEAEKESAEAHARVLEEQRASFEAQLVDRDLELARLRGEVVVKEELKRTRSRELAAVRATADAFDAKVREAETVNSGLRNELEAARADLMRTQSDREALRAELDRKRAELEAVASMKATVLAIVDGLDRLGSDTKLLRTEAAAALETLASARSSAAPMKAADDAKGDEGAWFESNEDEDDGEEEPLPADAEGDRPTSTGEELAAPTPEKTEKTESPATAAATE